MVHLTDVAAMALALPQVTEQDASGRRSWAVAGKVFAWERPFTKADLKRFGDVTPPDGPILAVRVEDLGEREAVLAQHPGPLFTIPHFDGYPAVLVHLRSATTRLVRDTLEDGWLAMAPKRSIEAYLAGTQRRPPIPPEAGAR